MVFYRKYRPQTLSELDLTAVRNKLTAILQSSFGSDDPRLSSKRTPPPLAGSVPHAFLFTGPKGLGKTSAARIVAKALNCENRNSTQNIKRKAKKDTSSKFSVLSSEGIEPCNSCDACISITNGSNIDVVEIDAASNRGIDEIRSLREKIKYAPTNLRRKVYIIDEVHMLTTEAFNALLKTLEEPPAHVVFILATTEFSKLPATIVSRAFHVQFEKPTREEIFRSLKRVIDGERLEFENGVLEKAAELSDRAFRDGAKILEELALAAGDKKITSKLLETVYKTDSIERAVTQLIHAAAVKSCHDALKVIQELADKGCDFKVVTEKIVEELRQLILLATGVIENHPKGANVTLDIGSIETLLGYFNEAYKNIKTSVLPQLPLELAVVKFCISTEESSPVIPVKDEALQRTHLDKTKDVTQPKSSPQMAGSDEFLKSLIEKVKKDNFSVAGVLRSVKVLKITDDGVELVTPHKFHGEKLADRKIQKLLEEKAAEILGKSVKIIVSIGNE